MEVYSQDPYGEEFEEEEDSDEIMRKEEESEGEDANDKSKP